MKNIELVKKWLEDNDSVSHAELVANSADAYAAAYAANAAAYSAGNDRSNAEYWVKQFEELEK